MAENVKWDTSKISSLIRNLNNEKETIERNKSFLMSINSEVEKAWQGYAGRAFDDRMDIDVENLQAVIKGMEELTADLNRIINDCYEPCEENIRNKINNLRSRV